MTAPADVDAYIAAAPPEARPLLQALRKLVHETVPSVEERISYGMPAYELNGRRLLHIAAAKRHVSVYGLVHVDFPSEELGGYLDHRSTLHFAFHEPLPVDALRRAIEHKASSFR